jgi:hypothetical protein
MWCQLYCAAETKVYQATGRGRPQESASSSRVAASSDGRGPPDALGAGPSATVQGAVISTVRSARPDTTASRGQQSSIPDGATTLTRGRGARGAVQFSAVPHLDQIPMLRLGQRPVRKPETPMNERSAVAPLDSASCRRPIRFSVRRSGVLRFLLVKPNAEL